MTRGVLTRACLRRHAHQSATVRARHLAGEIATRPVSTGRVLASGRGTRRVLTAALDRALTQCMRGTGQVLRTARAARRLWQGTARVLGARCSELLAGYLRGTQGTHRTRAAGVRESDCDGGMRGSSQAHLRRRAARRRGCTALCPLRRTAHAAWARRGRDAQFLQQPERRQRCGDCAVQLVRAKIPAWCVAARPRGYSRTPSRRGYCRGVPPESPRHRATAGVTRGVLKHAFLRRQVH